MKDIAESRVRIVEAADRLFYGQGIQSVTMEQVRAEADVSLKRLYTTFPSKSDVVLAVLEHRRQMWESGIARAVDAAPHCAREDPGRLRLPLRLVRTGRLPWLRLRQRLRRARRDIPPRRGGRGPGTQASFQQLMSELVQQAGGSGALGIQLAVLAEGAQTTSAICGDPRDGPPRQGCRRSPHRTFLPAR